MVQLSTAVGHQISHLRSAHTWFLDAIASPSTYPCQCSGSASEWVSHSQFQIGDSYRISELCELVYRLLEHQCCVEQLGLDGPWEASGVRTVGFSRFSPYAGQKPLVMAAVGCSRPTRLLRWTSVAAWLPPALASYSFHRHIL